MLDRTSEDHLVEPLAQSKANLKVNQTRKLGKFDILEKNYKKQYIQNQ